MAFNDRLDKGFHREWFQIIFFDSHKNKLQYAPEAALNLSTNT